MATAADIVKIAKREIGVAESPEYSNNVKYNTWYYGRAVRGTAYPWCMTFVQWVFDQADVALGLKTASCTELMNYAKKQGKWITSGYKAGDVLFFQFDKDAYADHTGICESATSATVTSIEGNTSISGSQTNGGEVCRQTRKIGLVMGAYRPSYTTAEGGKTVTITLPTLKRGSKNGSVTALQQLLTTKGYDTNGIDGEFGKNTEVALKKFQKAKNLTQDGVCGKNSWTAILT